MNRTSNLSKHALSRWARRGLAAGSGFVGVVALVLIAAPLAAASSPISFAPPYSGFTSTTSNYLSSSGCTATAHEPVTPSWSATTGTFSFSGKASAGSCLNSYSSASVDAQSIINSPTFSGTHGGTSIVYVDWSYAVAARASVALLSSANFSYVSASVTGTVYTELYDVTNGSISYVTGTTATLFGATFYSTGLYVLSTGPTLVYQYLYGVLHKGHTYQVTLWVTADLGVSVYNASGTASASVNLGGSNGVTLTSVTIY